MEKQKKWAGWLIFALIAAVALVAVAMTSRATGKTPEASAMQEPALKELFPDATEFAPLNQRSETLLFAYEAKKGSEILGYALRNSVQGYGGPIELTVGVNTDKTLRGLRVGGANFNETEGLGAKAKAPAFTDQFQGKKTPVALGDGIDSIAGATVTSRAITDGVNAAAEQLAVLLTGNKAPLPQAAATGRTANASVLGYGGPVLVRLTLGDANEIAALSIGGERFSETEGVGSRVREEAFTAQFIGKKPPLTLGNGIDAASGATVSSQAAVDAVNEAAQFLMQK